MVAHPPALKVLNLRGRGNLLNITKVSSLVQYNATPDTTRVLLCIDSECQELERTSQEVQPLEKDLRGQFPKLHVSYVLVDHSLEGWLLQDRQALGQLLGRNAKVPDYSNPEDNCRPAELLNDIYRTNSRDYKKTKDAPLLAEQVDVNTIAKASDTFRAFQQAVLR